MCKELRQHMVTNHVSSEPQKREKGEGEIKKIMIENFLKLMKDNKEQIQESPKPQERLKKNLDIL